FRWRTSLSFGTKSQRLKVFSLFPIPWIGVNSGVSRKRPARSPFAAINQPHFAPPIPNVVSIDGLPKDPYWASRLPLDFIKPRPERVVAFTTRLVLSPYS